MDREALRESVRLSLAKKTEAEKKASRDRLFRELAEELGQAVYDATRREVAEQLSRG
jgi:hypothetical protein